MDKLNGADIDATCGLSDLKQVGIALNLARENNLLLIATREILRGQIRIGRAYIEALHFRGGFGLDRRIVHKKSVGLMRQIAVLAENGGFPSHKVHDQTFALAILGHVGNAIGPPRLSIAIRARQIQRSAVDFH